MLRSNLDTRFYQSSNKQKGGRSPDRPPFLFRHKYPISQKSCIIPQVRNFLFTQESDWEFPPRYSETLTPRHIFPGGKNPANSDYSRRENAHQLCHVAQGLMGTHQNGQ